MLVKNNLAVISYNSLHYRFIQVEECNDSLRQCSQKTVSELLGYNSLYRAQLAEMGSRLEQARKQGQKVAEIKKSGEISVLQEQLGSKSK